jgi:hypothetical protein
MADLIAFTPERVLTLTGHPAPGAAYTVNFYQTGSTTPVTVYQDVAATVPHPATVTANSTGTFPQCFAASGEGAIKAVIRTATGATYATIDPVFRSPLSVSQAANLGFSPTADILATDVQSAIEEVYDGITTVLQDYGVAVTGNAPLIANLDLVTTPSGFYRFNATTTGTFPTGVAAADSGTLLVVRRTADRAIMMLWPDPNTGTPQAFIRHTLVTWQAWREILSVPQGAARGDVIYRGDGAWQRLAKGGAGQVVVWGANDPAAGSPGAQSAAVSLSGAGPFATAVPTWATQAEIHIFGGSLSGTDHFLVQLSTSGAYVTTGYDSYSTSSGTQVTSTAGIVGKSAGAPELFYGTLTMRKITGNTWFGRWAGANATGGDDAIGGRGHIALAGPIDGIRVTKSGTDTFDAGQVVVYWS